MPAYLIVNYKVEDPALYGSKGYQEVIGKRLAATSQHFAVLVEGLPG